MSVTIKFYPFKDYQGYWRFCPFDKKVCRDYGLWHNLCSLCIKTANSLKLDDAVYSDNVYEHGSSSVWEPISQKKRSG